MKESDLLARITINPAIFGGKPIIRGKRLAVEHVLGMLAAGDSPETILQGYPWMERADIQACLAFLKKHLHCGIVRLVDLSATRQAPACLSALSRYATILEQHGMVTVEPGRVRVRPATSE